MSTPHKLINPDFHIIKIAGIVILRLLQCNMQSHLLNPNSMLRTQIQPWEMKRKKQNA